MLVLKSIKKDYIVGGNKVPALKGVDIAFRKSEFVSILGPSGCGKTTLLNIIGGLDEYTDGELFIDNICTKEYSDREWDTYRNKRIGFVFQSYNLIPHQTISENVELALAISGIDKAERVQRAHDALDKVGLEGQYHKKPNQLSGGQCQRVAIARAIVNNPEILLADEPTGALDTGTSVQIMELIKEISQECLVIMVTHNPELAEKYSTRIIRLLDGELVSDSQPYPIREAMKTTELELANKLPNQNNDVDASEIVVNKAKKEKKSKLSFWAAFKLSLKNLLSKRSRTIMVSIAGSIGIIGVSLVLALSSGLQGYINNMQNDMLSGNPISVSEQAFDLGALLEGFTSTEKAEIIQKNTENGYVNVDNVIAMLVDKTDNMAAFQVSNNITKEYVDFVKAMPKEYYGAISTQYGLNLSNNLYTDFVLSTKTGKETKKMSLSAANQTFKSIFEDYASNKNSQQFKNFANYYSMVTESFMQAPNDENYILSQYNVVTSTSNNKIAKNANEIMIVLNDNAELSDLLLAQYGYFSQDEFINIINKSLGDKDYNQALWKEKFSYEELLGKEFVWYPNEKMFHVFIDPAEPTKSRCDYEPYLNKNWRGGRKLKVTAILTPKEGNKYGSLKSGFYYTQALAEEIIKANKGSQILGVFDQFQTDKIVCMPDSDDYGQLAIKYKYNYWNGKEEKEKIGIVGTEQNLTSLIGSAFGQEIPKIYTLSLRELGGVDTPGSIKIYPNNFKDKDKIVEYLQEWNSNKDLVVNGKTIKATDRDKMAYTDNLAVVIGMINSLIQIITISLVAFTALSLVVSTVMIAIITYVSVIERIKEIGVIRSLGGRKKDVSALFNAETFIIGSSSGIIGVIITYLLSLIINQIVGHIFGIFTIASLPIWIALIMLVLSIGLTMLAGIIPASMAARKDPVNALRSE